MTRRQQLALAIWIATLAAAPAQAQKITLTTEQLAPSAYIGPDGKVTGVVVEKMRELMRRTGHDYEIQVLPWRRAYMMAQAEVNTCVFPTTRTAEREALFQWVGPTHDNDWTLFALKSRHFRFKNLNEVGELRIGTNNGDVRNEALQAGGYRVEPVQEAHANVRKLMLGRIDLWATSLRVGLAEAAANGWSDKIEPVLTWRRTQQYLACHSKMSAAEIARLNAALEVMKQDGTTRAIERRFDAASVTR